MGDKSAIEWTDATWNPVVGCTAISSGCALCYAKVLHDRRHAAWLGGTWPDAPEQYHFPFETVRFLPERLDMPLKWRTPRKIFVNSVSDLFHESLREEEIDQVFRVMARASQHTFQALTKRADRMQGYLDSRRKSCEQANEITGRSFPLTNVWLGVSVENPAAIWRLGALRETPAAVRWLSIEPLLEDLGTIDLTGIDWVVVGGESGKHARPMHPDWVRSIRFQCQAAGVAFFFKQWGEWCTPLQMAKDDRACLSASVTDRGRYIQGIDGSSTMVWPAGKAAGRYLDGREWNEFPNDAGKVGADRRKAVHRT